MVVCDGGVIGLWMMALLFFFCTLLFSNVLMMCLVKYGFG